jgi:hypothetical protein
VYEDLDSPNLNREVSPSNIKSNRFDEDEDTFGVNQSMQEQPANNLSDVVLINRYNMDGKENKRVPAVFARLWNLKKERDEKLK